MVAVLAAIVGFTHLLAGFDNPTLVRLVGTLLDRPYTSRQATYDLHRLKRKGLITRIPGRHRYQVTPLGRRVAVLFTKAYARVLTPGLAALDPVLPTSSQHEASWPPPGDDSTAPSINSSTMDSPLHDRATWSDCEPGGHQAKLEWRQLA